MSRTKARETLATGVYLEHNCIELRATSAGVTLTKRLPGDTDLKDAIRERAKLLAKAQTAHKAPTRHTLAADAPVYLRLTRTLHATTQRSRKAHLDAWVDRLGEVPRHRITDRDVLDARVAWLDAGLAPKTINHRVHTLRRLYKTLDGSKADTPCDDVASLPVHRTPIQRVSPTVILDVHRALWAAIAHPVKQPSQATADRIAEARKTHARFCVLVSTGRRPSELSRAQPLDVDLEARTWVPRDGKGGWSPGLYLNDDMLTAWRLFAKAEAWGDFSTSAYAKRLRRAGWPTDVRPYNARHSLLIALVEAGADLSDAQTHAGHKQLATTRNTYTGIRNSRVQRTSELLDGRLMGFSVATNVGDTE